MRNLLFLGLTFWVTASTLFAQSTHWRIEAESPQTRVLLRGDTLDITAPKGLSLWWDEPMRAPCSIEYRACVVMEGGPFDRLSDLNCFWMASIPSKSISQTGVEFFEVSKRPEVERRERLSPLSAIPQRGGRFVESYRRQCYYLGFGGNYNSTTRFRRYDGDTLAIDDPARRPPILKEYTDSAHLLRPNHWYAVRIEVTTDGHTRYYIDDELLVDYLDPSPLPYGWFAFRTTWSHTRLTAFRIDSQ